MSVPLTLLGLLEREPSHGYDLKRDYGTSFGRGKPHREQGTTVILVTHDARVAAYADREVVVRDGKVSALTTAAPFSGAAQASGAAQ
jgi:ABC-type hemin transport system ATPase subunit